ncbi:BNIP - RELATED [Salix purpurea]|uniref:BNIP - RELATED n=1 Tax=Salix purpurea TaxID=77065 RepID=A0A9Q0W5J2_SALPP|nr:BNIP - RELATED [Salix purpurea]
MDRRFSRESSRESKGSIALQKKIVENEEESFDDSTRSSSSELTQEWLDAARRMVASTPSRCESPSRLASWITRAQISGEILAKSAKHSRNKSESLVETPAEPSPASQFQKWFSNILKPPSDCNAPSSYRKSRFQTEPPATTPQGIPVTSRRTFKLSSIEKVAPKPNINGGKRKKREGKILVDLESLMMEGKLSILVVGQDDEVGSQCTVLTDNYCEDAYDLLQTPVLKKLLVNY